MKTIWTIREAERAALDSTNEYGEIKSTALKDLSDAAWWSGVRYGVAAAFSPALMLWAIVAMWIAP